MRSGKPEMVSAAMLWASEWGYEWDWSVEAEGGLTPLHLAAVLPGRRGQDMCHLLREETEDGEWLWCTAKDRDGATPADFDCLMRARAGGPEEGAALDSDPDPVSSDSFVMDPESSGSLYQDQDSCSSLIQDPKFTGSRIQDPEFSHIRIQDPRILPSSSVNEAGVRGAQGSEATTYSSLTVLPGGSSGLSCRQPDANLPRQPDADGDVDSGPVSGGASCITATALDSLADWLNCPPEVVVSGWSSKPPPPPPARLLSELMCPYGACGSPGSSTPHMRELHESGTGSETSYQCTSPTTGPTPTHRLYACIPPCVDPIYEGYGPCSSSCPSCPPYWSAPASPSTFTTRSSEDSVTRDLFLTRRGGDSLSGSVCLLSPAWGWSMESWREEGAGHGGGGVAGPHGQRQQQRRRAVVAAPSLSPQRRLSRVLALMSRMVALAFLMLAAGFVLARAG